MYVHLSWFCFANELFELSVFFEPVKLNDWIENQAIFVVERNFGKKTHAIN